MLGCEDGIPTFQFRPEDGGKRGCAELMSAIGAGRWAEAVERVTREYLNQPNEYITLEKLRRAAGVDRRVSIREILEQAFGLIPGLKLKDELLEEEFAKFVAEHTPTAPTAVPAIKNYFKAYFGSKQLQVIIDSGEFAQLHTNPGFSFSDFKAVPDDFRKIVPEYIQDYVPLNQFS